MTWATMETPVQCFLAKASPPCCRSWCCRHGPIWSSSAQQPNRTPMPKLPKKTDFPVSRVRRYLEPGPIVLVSSKWQGATNSMTLGLHTILEFSPSVVGLTISGGNHSYRMIRECWACVINLPTTALRSEERRAGEVGGDTC